MDVSVLEINPVPAGNLKAFVKVQIGPMVIDGFRVVQQPDQKAWVSVPQERGTDGKYYNRIQIEDDDLLNRVRSTVLSAWESSDVH
jgi:DNA-binding cell septation regulator SpoVG